MRNRSEDPIWPAAPVTATRTGALDMSEGSGCKANRACNSTAARARNAVHKGNSINALRRYNRFRSPRAPTPHMANATIRKPRPKYLSLASLLFEIRLPLAGWVSILHRISGLLLFLGGVWLVFQ